MCVCVYSGCVLGAVVVDDDGGGVCLCARGVYWVLVVVCV